MANAKSNTKTKKEPAEVIYLPEGRLINNSLFEKDAYTDPRTEQAGTPSYKLEIALDADKAKEIEAVEDKIADVFEKEGNGDDAQDFLDGKLAGPFKNGDKMAARRERDDKDGDAYKGKTVFRANTSFNLEGVDGPGGIAVFDEDAKPVGFAERGIIYNGCYGIAAVTIGYYIDNKGDPATKFYLVGFQKTRDGDKLFVGRDNSKLFKPVGRPAGGGETRRRRAG
jgi:hypothetical protein